MASGLKYSDRERLASSGSLGPVRQDEAPFEFRQALSMLIRETHERDPLAGQLFYRAFHAHARQHFAKNDQWFPATGVTARADYRTFSMTTGDVLDLTEILVEEATSVYFFQGETGGRNAFADIESRLNQLFLRHRFGYRMEGGEIRKVGSPALDARVVEPALQAVHRPGWEAVERTFREALHHQRGGPAERDDALTAANAALEAALKAAGLKGDRLSALAKSLRNSDLVPGELKSVPEAIDTLLKRSGAIRDSYGDAHGASPNAVEVPEELADLAIYWTGAFINYLAAATARRS